MAKGIPTDEEALARLGRRIGEIREIKGFTQETFAVAAKLQLSHLRAIEQGAHAPNATTLFRIARTLGVDPIHLFTLPVSEKTRGRPSRRTVADPVRKRTRKRTA